MILRIFSWFLIYCLLWVHFILLYRPAAAAVMQIYPLLDNKRHYRLILFDLKYSYNLLVIKLWNGLINSDINPTKIWQIQRCAKQVPQNLNELKECCLEHWIKYWIIWKRDLVILTCVYAMKIKRLLRPARPFMGGQMSKLSRGATHLPL